MTLLDFFSFPHPRILPHVCQYNEKYICIYMPTLRDGRTIQVVTAKTVFFTLFITSALSPLYRHGNSFYFRQLLKMDSESLQCAGVWLPLFLLF